MSDDADEAEVIILGPEKLGSVTCFRACGEADPFAWSLSSFPWHLRIEPHLQKDSHHQWVIACPYKGDGFLLEVSSFPKEVFRVFSHHEGQEMSMGKKSTFF